MGEDGVEEVGFFVGVLIILVNDGFSVYVLKCNVSVFTTVALGEFLSLRYSLKNRRWLPSFCVFAKSCPRHNLDLRNSIQ